MAAILTLFAGVLGLVVALVSLALGGGILTALLLWTATGLAATVLGLIWSLIPSRAPVRA
ncbi:MAG: hypothetical protein KBF85_04995 [Tabrizicola sp.]|jgi:hypothetical protein|nr:hypothetical protein [Tabrizicola sp.]